MVTVNDSHSPHTDSKYRTEAAAPVRVVRFTPYLPSTQEDADSQKHAMSDCDHAMMERLLLELRQRSEV